MPIFSLKRSSAATGANAKRPTASALLDGEPAVNLNAVDPALYFKNSTTSLVKVAPICISPTAPNAVPPAGGSAGNSRGEFWVDTTTDRLRIFNGFSWLTSANLETTGLSQPYDTIFPPPLHIWGAKRLITEPATPIAMRIVRATPNGNPLINVPPSALNSTLNNLILGIGTPESYLRATRMYDQIALRALNGSLTYKENSPPTPLALAGSIYAPAVTTKMTDASTTSTTTGPAMWIAVQFTLGTFTGTSRTIVEFNGANNIDTLTAGGFSIKQNAADTIQVSRFGSSSPSITTVYGLNPTGLNSFLFYDGGGTGAQGRIWLNGSPTVLSTFPAPGWASDGTNYTDSNLSWGGSSNINNTSNNFQNRIISLAYWIGPRANIASQSDLAEMMNTLHNSVR